MDFKSSKIVLVDTEEQLLAAAAAMSTTKAVGVDIESCPEGPQSYEGFVSLI